MGLAKDAPTDFEVMIVPLPIDVKPYSLNGVIGGDNYLTHYKAVTAEGNEFTITEFNPAYMVSRDDDGVLQVSERFTKEFFTDREEFLRRIEVFQELRDASLHPVVETFERNNSAYLVRRACGLTTIDQYMGSHQMDFDEAYYFIRPLLLSMAQAAEKGVVFNIGPNDFRVNSYKNLVICAPISWDNNFHSPLTQIVKLYYRLITGVDAPDQGAPGFSAYGIDVPGRIEAMVSEILGGDILYGSLDDFFKKFKALIDGTKEASQDDGKKTLAVMRGVAAVLAIMFAISLTGLALGWVRAYRANNFWANPDNFATDETLNPPPHDFSAVTITHPRNAADALRGSFATYSGFMLFRGENGLMSRLFGDVIFVPGAAGILALADDRLIIPDVLPSFIVGHGGYLYFSDANSYGRIYRATTSGEELTRMTHDAALNLAVVNDYLFYTNADYNHYLHLYDINRERHEVILRQPVTATLASGSYLFFIAEQDDYSVLYSWDLNENIRRELSRNVSGSTLGINGDIVFFFGADGLIHAVSSEGRHVFTLPLENVRTFDVFFQWIVFTEEGVHVPRAYNMDTRTLTTLSNTEWVSHIWAHDGRIYGIDHRNPTLVHNFQFPLR